MSEEFGSLNAFMNSLLSRESTKGCDRYREHNSEQLFVFLAENMKGVFTTGVVGSFPKTIHVLPYEGSFYDRCREFISEN